MARQQVNVRLSSFTIAQLKDLASRFDMSESSVIMLAIDRLVRDTQHGVGVLSDETGNETEQTGEPEHLEHQVKGGQGDGKGKVRKEARTRRRHNP